MKLGLNIQNKIDQRRLEFGLAPFQEYKKTVDGFCYYTPITN